MRKPWAGRYSFIYFTLPICVERLVHLKFINLGLGGAEHLSDRLALRVRLADRRHTARAGLHAASERRQIPQHLKAISLTRNKGQKRNVATKNSN